MSLGECRGGGWRRLCRHKSSQPLGVSRRRPPTVLQGNDEESYPLLHEALIFGRQPRAGRPEEKEEPGLDLVTLGHVRIVGLPDTHSQARSRSDLGVSVRCCYAADSKARTGSAVICEVGVGDGCSVIVPRCGEKYSVSRACRELPVWAPEDVGRDRCSGGAPAASDVRRDWMWRVRHRGRCREWSA